MYSFSFYWHKSFVLTVCSPDMRTAFDEIVKHYHADDVSIMTVSQCGPVYWPAK